MLSEHIVKMLDFLLSCVCGKKLHAALVVMRRFVFRRGLAISTEFTLLTSVSGFGAINWLRLS